MPIPNGLLAAVAHEDAGRLILVVGAGCSYEEPTGIPLARDCAIEAHRRLVADGIMDEGTCQDPSDLSSLADSVLSQNGDQLALVERMPLRRFKLAQPNQGHLIAAAMMAEHAIKSIVTLNFDLALSNALAQLGVKEVAVLSGPHEHTRMGVVNLVYLHRNVDADPNDWILTSESLATAWEGQWEQVIASAMLSTPVTVFAGLGSPAAVLTESANKIRNAIPEGVDIYQVDPGDKNESAFFQELKIPEEHYVQEGWITFMRQLDARLTSEHLHRLKLASALIVNEEGIEEEELDPLLSQLSEGGLVHLGKLRADWMLEQVGYLPDRAIDPRYMASLLLAVASIERMHGCVANIEPGGLVRFEIEDKRLSSIRVASGRGLKSWLALEASLGQMDWQSAQLASAPVLVAGVGARPAQISPPADITGGDQEGSIIDEGGTRTLLSVDELRAMPERSSELIK